MDIEGPKSSKLEKPEFLYHGSVIPNIEELKPNEGHTPYEGIGPRVYATQLPAFAAAHSWDWSSDEGIRLSADNGNVLLEVPEKFSERLNVPVYIYKVPSDTFSLSKETTGYTFDSTKEVKAVGVEKFNSVIEAVEYFGGKVSFLK